MNRLYRAAVEAKHALSARSRAIVRVELGRASGRDPGHRASNSRSYRPTCSSGRPTPRRQLLAAAELEWSDVTRLLLVGGSTRMPMVVEMLRRLTGLEPDHTVHPDEAVARGAALYAAYLLAAEAGARPGRSPSATSIPTAWAWRGSNRRRCGRRNIVLIPRNTPLPAKVRDRFATKAEKQSDRRCKCSRAKARAGRMHGHRADRDPRPARRAAQDWPVEVTFEYASNGRLRVHGLVPGTHTRPSSAWSATAGLSDESIVRWKRPNRRRGGSTASRRSCGSAAPGRADAGGAAARLMPAILAGPQRRPPMGPDAGRLAAPAAAGRDAAAAASAPLRDRLAPGRPPPCRRSPRSPPTPVFVSTGSCGYGVAPNAVRPRRTGREAAAECDRPPGRQGRWCL